MAVRTHSCVTALDRH